MKQHHSLGRAQCPHRAAVVVITALLGWIAPSITQAASAPPVARGAQPSPINRSSRDFFGITTLHQISLTLSPEEWGILLSSRGGRGGRGGGFGVPLQFGELPNDAEHPVHQGGGFGGLFPLVHANLQIDTQALTNLGMRYKGNSSFSASEGMLRRNLKIKFDQFEDIRFEGLKTLNLNSGAVDGSRVRETLSFSVFRAAGVPASQTAYAEVTLTVPGEYEREYLGLYTLIEQVNKQFLKRYFVNNDGLLLKPERAQGGIRYLGETWSAYEATYRPEREATPTEARRVINFAKLVDSASDTLFRTEIGNYLDVDEFLRFIAVNALLMNLDSFLRGSHNYFVYLDPTSNKFTFIPWDQDLSLGSFGGGGAQMDLSLMHPYAGQNQLVARVLAIPEIKTKYRNILINLSQTAFAKTQLLGTIDSIEKAIRAPLAKEAIATASRNESPRGFGGRGGGIGRGGPPRSFVELRTASVADQLAGRSEGSIPTGGGGPRGGGGGGGGGLNFVPAPGIVLP